MTQPRLFVHGIATKVSVHEWEIRDISWRSLSRFTDSMYTVYTGTTPYPLVSMRETPSRSGTAFLGTVLLLAASTLVNSMTQTTVTGRFVCMGYDSRVCSTSSIRPSSCQICQDSCQSTFTDVQGSRSWLSGAEGGEQAFGRHGRPVAMAGGCSARATSCFWDIPFICCKNKLGIGISLD